MMLRRKSRRDPPLVPACLDVVGHNQPYEIDRSGGIAIDTADRHVCRVSVHVRQTSIIRVGGLELRELAERANPRAHAEPARGEADHGCGEETYGHLELLEW